MLTMPSSPMATNTSGLSTQPCGMPSAPYFGGSSARTDARESDGKHQPAERGRLLQESAPAHVGNQQGVFERSFVVRLRNHVEGRVHAIAPFSPAACLIAARMRPYVPQRQMLPVIASSMSASVGLGFFLSSAVADMICPAWQ